MTTIFDPLHFSAVTLDVAGCTRVSTSGLAARQRARLDTLLSAAISDSRFYKRHLRGVQSGVTPLRALPTVRRQTLMDHFDDWVTDPALKLTGLRAFAADPHRIGQPYLEKYLVWESSGTSHKSGIFVQDARTMAVYDALECLRRSSVRPLQRIVDPLMLSERFAFIGATTGHFASFITMQRTRELNPWLASSMESFSILQPTHLLVEALNAYRPTVIATYPTAAAMLAEQANRGNLRHVPAEVWTGGETLRPSVRYAIEKGLRCKVRNSYGASEFISLAWECSLGNLHLNADWAILEPVDMHGRPSPSGEFSHTTLLTNLANVVQPLIRYDLGDQVRLHSEQCRCGCTLPVIEVRGRRDDPVLMAGKSGELVTLLPLALTTVLEDEAAVFDFQLVQQNTHSLLLRLPLSGSAGAAVADRCREVLRRFGDVQELQPFKLVIELEQNIHRGPSGKAQKIVAQTRETVN